MIDSTESVYAGTYEKLSQTQPSKTPEYKHISQKSYIKYKGKSTFLYESQVTFRF